MKTVFNNAGLAHPWAHQLQETGRTSCGNYFFDGGTIYSYGSHFAIARHVTNQKGEKAILFTTRTYSHSTQRHISLTLRAIPADTLVLYVRDPSRRPTLQDMTTYEEAAATAHLKAKRARLDWSKQRHAAEAVRQLQHARDIAVFFGLPYELPELAALEQRLLENQAALKAREAAEQKERGAKEREWIAEFMQGVRRYVQHAVTSPVLRLSGEVVQTSLGVDVPLADAKRAWGAVMPLIDAGQTYNAPGVYAADPAMKVGGFRVDYVDPNGNVRAGCHQFLRAEVQRFGAILDATPWPARPQQEETCGT